jgi:ATP-dependent helicase/nuclease subunit A
MANIWVNASAGTGKTYFLIQTILDLLKNGTTPDRILCLTFTNAAAQEMQERLLTHPDPIIDDILKKPFVKIQTIHGFCQSVLSKVYGYELLCDDELDDMIMGCLKRCHLPFNDVFHLSTFLSNSKIQSLIKKCIHFNLNPHFFTHKNIDHSLASLTDKVFTKDGRIRKKITTHDPSAVIDYYYQKVENDLFDINDSFSKILVEVQKEYKKQKQGRCLVDYADVLIEMVKLLKNPTILHQLGSQIDHIIVDESQDTSPTQWDIILNLCSDIILPFSHKSICIVGDKKQSIYSFQGADRHYFEKIEKQIPRMCDDTPLTIKELHTSFRSTKDILSTVDTIFKTNHHAKRDDLGSFSYIVDDDVVICAAMLVKKLYANGHRDILILCRNRTPFMDPLDQILRDQLIPVSSSDRICLKEHLFVQDVLSFFKFMTNPQDDYNTLCLLKSPFFNLSNQDLENLSLKRLKNNGALCDVLPPNLKNNLDGMLLSAQNKNIVDIFLKIIDDTNYPIVGIEHVLDAMMTMMIDFQKDYPSHIKLFIDHIMSDKKIYDLLCLSSPVRLMTIHGSKGLEATTVIILDDGMPPSLSKEDVLKLDFDCILKPNAMMDIPKTLHLKENFLGNAYDEHRCLLYVAMTRARDHLYVIAPKECKEQSFGWHWKKLKESVSFPSIKLGETDKIQNIAIPPLWVQKQTPLSLASSHYSLEQKIGLLVHEFLEKYDFLDEGTWTKMIPLPYPKNLMTNPLWQSFFKEGRSEVSIAFQGNQYRLDRLSICHAKKIIQIIEFKTFYIDSFHHVSQVKKYVSILKNLYPSYDVHPYLVSITEQRIHPL